MFIGEHAVVGVGSLVLDNVDPYTVVAGSPASVRRTVHTQETTKPAHDP
jgi:acetyltransferase-like isoleucine patch superfamily enzyme